MLISPIFNYIFLSSSAIGTIETETMWHMMGFRMDGIYMAFFTPLILTAILFLGPLSTQAVSGDWKLYAGKNVHPNFLFLL